MIRTMVVAIKSKKALTLVVLFFAISISSLLQGLAEENPGGKVGWNGSRRGLLPQRK